MNLSQMLLHLIKTTAECVRSAEILQTPSNQVGYVLWPEHVSPPPPLPPAAAPPAPPHCSPLPPLLQPPSPTAAPLPPCCSPVPVPLPPCCPAAPPLSPRDCAWRGAFWRRPGSVKPPGGPAPKEDERQQVPLPRGHGGRKPREPTGGSWSWRGPHTGAEVPAGLGDLLGQPEPSARGCPTQMPVGPARVSGHV